MDGDGSKERREEDSRAPFVQEVLVLDPEHRTDQLYNKTK